MVWRKFFPLEGFLGELIPFSSWSRTACVPKDKALSATRSPRGQAASS